MWILGNLVLALTIFSIQGVRIGDVPTIPNGILNPPQPISSPPPAYTDKARQLGVEGVVTIEAAFDLDGRFDVLRVVKGLGFGLDESALAALSG